MGLFFQYSYIDLKQIPTSLKWGQTLDLPDRDKTIRPPLKWFRMR